MPEPSVELWLEIAKRYYKKTNYPNCIGSIDGKHIRIRKPAKSGSYYSNYKKFFSIVLLAVADANCSFIAIDDSRSYLLLSMNVHVHNSRSYLTMNLNF